MPVPIEESYNAGVPAFRSLIMLKERLSLYFRLVRLNKPVGIMLLLWPTLTALWLASDGHPDWKLVTIYTLGTILMRSAGCAVNDYADRDFDKHVKRTADRPVTSGKISGKEALAVAASLALLSFCLVIPLNTLTKQMSVAALIIAATYPYFKRFFAIPQAYLGIAFGFGIPMAFASIQDQIPVAAWVLLTANIFWAVAYDTEYAMVDRDDDLKIGIRTSAITFGQYDVLAVMLCYALSFALITVTGLQYGLGIFFLTGMFVAVLFAAYHYTLIRHRERMACFTAFRHNNWLGAVIFAGVVIDYAIR